MELSCFGWVGGTGGGGGGGISGSGTANTVAMFTGATSIGDSNFYQSDNITGASVINAGVTDSIAIGVQNLIDVENCYVFGERNDVAGITQNMLLGYDLTSDETLNVVIGNSNNTKTKYYTANVTSLVNSIPEKQYGGTDITTDASPLNIRLFQPQAINIYLVECYITCIKKSGAGAGTLYGGNSYILTAQVQESGGVAIIGTIQNTYTYEVNTAYSVTLVDNAGYLDVQVTGDVNDDVTWNVFAKVYYVN